MDEAADGLDVALARLVERGDLTAAQAEAVRAEVRVTSRPAAGGVRPAVEIAAWVGAVLAGAAGVTAATRFWAELEVWAQTALLALVAAALLVAGRSVLADRRPAARRITGLTWLFATIAAAAAVWVPLNELIGEPESLPVLIAALAATALAVALWRVVPGALQLIAISAGAVNVVVSTLTLPERPPNDLMGLAVWSLGIAMLLLAWAGIAAPRRTALALGGLATLGGAEILHFFYPRSGVLLGLAMVAALFVLGALLDQVLLTGLAAAALAVFVPQALGAFFPGSLNASATLFLAGVLVLAGALVTLRAARGGEMAAASDGLEVSDAT